MNGRTQGGIATPAKAHAAEFAALFGDRGGARQALQALRRIKGFGAGTDLVQQSRGELVTGTGL